MYVELKKVFLSSVSASRNYLSVFLNTVIHKVEAISRSVFSSLSIFNRRGPKVPLSQKITPLNRQPSEVFPDVSSEQTPSPKKKIDKNSISTPLGAKNEASALPNRTVENLIRAANSEAGKPSLVNQQHPSPNRFFSLSSNTFSPPPSTLKPGRHGSETTIPILELPEKGCPETPSNLTVSKDLLDRLHLDRKSTIKARRVPDIFKNQKKVEVKVEDGSPLKQGNDSQILTTLFTPSVKTPKVLGIPSNQTVDPSLDMAARRSLMFADLPLDMIHLPEKSSLDTGDIALSSIKKRKVEDPETPGQKKIPALSSITSPDSPVSMRTSLLSEIGFDDSVDLKNISSQLKASKKSVVKPKPNLFEKRRKVPIPEFDILAGTNSSSSESSRKDNPQTPAALKQFFSFQTQTPKTSGASQTKSSFPLNRPPLDSKNLKSKKEKASDVISPPFQRENWVSMNNKKELLLSLPVDFVKSAPQTPQVEGKNRRFSQITTPITTPGTSTPTTPNTPYSSGHGNFLRKTLDTGPALKK